MIPIAPAPAGQRDKKPRVHVNGPWRWSTLLWAPHRLCFFAAACVMALSALWWAADLTLRVAGLPAWPYAWPPGVSHALVMTLGFMPLFFAGFLFTAGPKWLSRPEVTARSVLLPVLALVVGWAAFLAGTHLHRGLAVAGGVAATVGWGLICWRYLGMVRDSQVQDQVHGRLIGVACALGLLALVLAVAGLVVGEVQWCRLAAVGGLWFFVVPVYVVVAHRMIPFFTAAAVPALDAWKPYWLLWTLLAMVALQGVWAVVGVLGWTLPAPLQVVRVLASGASAVLVLALALRWGLVQSLRIRLLAMLHLGFVWLGIAFGLDMAGVPLLALHALTMGCLGSLLLAMATRVSCGHGGRTLTADNPAWALFWLLQGAVVLRLWAAASPDQGLVLVLAALAWLLSVGGWALRYGRWFGQPRVDGRPG